MLITYFLLIVQMVSPTSTNDDKSTIQNNYNTSMQMELFTTSTIKNLSPLLRWIKATLSKWKFKFDNKSSLQTKIQMPEQLDMPFWWIRSYLCWIVTGIKYWLSAPFKITLSEFCSLERYASYSYPFNQKYNAYSISSVNRFPVHFVFSSSSSLSFFGSISVILLVNIFDPFGSILIFLILFIIAVMCHH